MNSTQSSQITYRNVFCSKNRKTGIKMNNFNNIELLSPAGSFEGLKSSIGNGADSVYFGADRYSARGKAQNFDDKMMEQAIDYAHLHSVKAYLAINTLISDYELEIALDIAISAYLYGVDAIIVQDLGFASLLKERLPDIVLHASTQATIYDKRGILACSRSGISRVILPREFSVTQIKDLTGYANELGMETEVFVHGALCVSYSGQCLMSSLIGGRSGNRGECAQPCRLSYTLMLDGKAVSDNSPVLATKDMSGINYIEELRDAGVKALKIEGRMRSPEYAGTVTKNFRMAMDRIPEYDINISLNQLLLSFNRGGSFTENYLSGVKGPEIMAGKHPGSFGVLLGNIVLKNSNAGIIDIDLSGTAGKGFEPGKGDVLSIRRDNFDGEIVSAPIGTVEIKDDRIRVKGFHPDAIEKININDRVYVMEDNSLNVEVIKSDTRKTDVEGRLFAEGSFICFELKVVNGIAKDISYIEKLNLNEFAENEDGNQNDFREIPEQRCILQLSKMKSSSFNAVAIKVENMPKAPISILNQLRRETVAGLENVIKNYYKRELPDTFVEELDIDEIMDKIDKVQDSPECEGYKRLETSACFYFWDGLADSVLCGANWYEIPIMSFYDEQAYIGIKDIKIAEPDSKIAIAIPPGATPDISLRFEVILKRLAKEKMMDAVISGSPGIGFLADELGVDAFTDTSSNIFNLKTVKFYQKSGAKTIVPSAELSGESIIKMVKSGTFDKNIFVELPAYGRLRLMYTEHCPVGFNRQGCKICLDKEKSFSLKDRKKISFPLVCHPRQCTVDVLNSDTLCAPNEIIEILKFSNTRARLIFLNETKDERKTIVDKFSEFQNSKDESESADIADEIRKYSEFLSKKYGGSITRGHYNRGVN